MAAFTRAYIIRSAGDTTPCTCPKCKHLREISQFYAHSVRGDGATRYRAICKSCRRKGPRKNWARPAQDAMYATGKCVCLDCRIEKPLNEYSTNGVFADGVIRYRRLCKKCAGARVKKNYYKNKARTTAKRGASYQSYICTLVNKTAARRGKLAYALYNIDAAYLIELFEQQAGLCALTGRAMTWITGKGRVMTNISVDRIDSAKGYERGNIQLVCLQANIMKQDLDLAVLVDWCRAVVKRNNNGRQYSSLR